MHDGVEPDQSGGACAPPRDPGDVCAPRGDPGDVGAPADDPDDEAFLRLTGLMPLTAASRVVGTAPGTLRRHIATGACDARKIGRRWYVNGQDLDRWARRHPHVSAAAPRSPAGAGHIAAVACGCDALSPRLGGRARAELDIRARRVQALARFRELEQQVAADVLGIRGSTRLAQECRSWVDAAVDDASRDAARAALGALLEALAGRLAAAPSSVLADLDQAALRDAVELT
jgi:Helix-turn-helix domain